MPGRTTLVLALLVVVIGAALRFYHYYYLQQYLLKLLIGIAIVIFLCSMLLRLFKTRPQTYKDSLVWVVVIGILCCFTYESAASNKRKNQKYLENFAGLINRFSEKNGRPPTNVEEALKAAGQMPMNRGDADGNNYSYIRLSDRIYIMRTAGANQKNDAGGGDDVELNYLNGNSVSFEDLSTWIERNGTDEEKFMLEHVRPPYGPLGRKNDTTRIDPNNDHRPLAFGRVDMC